MSAAILQSAVARLAGSVIVGAVIGVGVGLLTEHPPFLDERKARAALTELAV